MSMLSWERNVLYNHTKTTANECHDTPCPTNGYITCGGRLAKVWIHFSHPPTHIFGKCKLDTAKLCDNNNKEMAHHSRRKRCLIHTTSVWSKEHLLRAVWLASSAERHSSWDDSLSGTAASNVTELLLFTALRFSNKSTLGTAHLHMMEVYIVSIYCGLCSVWAVLFMLNCAVAHSSTPTQGSYSSYYVNSNAHFVMSIIDWTSLLSILLVLDSICVVSSYE